MIVKWASNPFGGIKAVGTGWVIITNDGISEVTCRGEWQASFISLASAKNFVKKEIQS